MYIHDDFIYRSLNINSVAYIYYIYNNMATKNIIHNIVKKTIIEALTEANDTVSEEFILIDDRDGQEMGTYSNKNDAIQDAKSMNEADPSGVYKICTIDANGERKCIYSTYDEDKIQFNESLKRYLKNLIG